MQNHAIRKDFAPECQQEWMIWVYIDGQLEDTKWFDTEAECDETCYRMLRDGAAFLPR